MTTENAQAPVAPQPGSPDYDAAMIAKFNSGQPPQADTPPVEPQRPAGLPEKFKSVEDMARSYAELERKLHGGAPKDPPQTPAQTTETPAQGAPKEGEGDGKGTEGKPAEGAPDASALDFNAMSNEVAESGDLSAQSREALKAKGIPDQVIDFYVNAAKGEVANFTKAIHEAAGGEEQYDRIRQWAGENLSQSEKDFLQAQVNAGTDQARLAISVMRQKYEAANGREPTLLGGKPGGTALGYESIEQMKSDMRDERYKKDAAWRAQVERRIAATTSF